MKTREMIGYIVLAGITLLCALFFILNTNALNKTIDSVTSDQGGVPNDTPTEASVAAAHLDRITDKQFGITFPYRTGEDGYHMETTDTAMSKDPDFVRGYQFVLQSDLKALENATTPQEAPTSISLRVYKNTEKVWPSVWALKHPAESHADKKIEEETETAVGGAKAIHYVADGLYATDTYVITQDMYVYVFTGSYIDENSMTKKDFEPLIQAVTFIPTETAD